MFGLSKLYLYAILALVYFGSVIGWGTWQRYDGRADLAREIAAASAEKRLADIEEKDKIDEEINNTPDSDLADIILNSGWLLSEETD